MGSQPSVALVHDWLVDYGGAERVLEALLELCPEAPVYTLVFHPENFKHSPIGRTRVHVSRLNRWPLSRRFYRYYLPFMPMQVEQIDLRGYDIVISVSHAVAHGVLTGPNQLHINYILTPARFAWHHYQEYLEERKLHSGIRGLMVKQLLHKFRIWDHAASARVDQFVAISNWIADAVRSAYRRDADVIYPPVNVDRFVGERAPDDYYITVARLVPNKRINLIVEACTKLGRRLLVVGTGPEIKRLEKMAGDCVEIVGWQNDKRLPELLARARAFIQAAHEDFGIAILEAQAAGCPVIALAQGAALETVVAGKTGVFFPDLSAEALASAIQRFEEIESEFEAEIIRAHAQRFAKERFLREFRSYLDEAWKDYKSARYGD